MEMLGSVLHHVGYPLEFLIAFEQGVGVRGAEREALCARFARRSQCRLYRNAIYTPLIRIQNVTN